MNYYIFGAHSRGYTLYEYLRKLEPHNTMQGFLYDNDEQNPTDIEGIPVYDIGDNTVASSLMIDRDIKVYIATRGVYHTQIEDVLRDLGFKDIVRVTPELDIELRNRYVRAYFEERGRVFNKIDAATGDVSGRDEAVLYIAKTVGDKPFESDVPLQSYEKIIQVGCDLTDDRLSEAAFFDNHTLKSAGTKDDISSRNAQFCELTALYWIWKNATQDIVGLEHWRRRFLLPTGWADIMKRGMVDVILPVPLCVMPSLEANYKSRHLANVWDKLFAIMKELYPDDYDRAIPFFESGRLYSPCNMIIAKREIMVEYCDWLFPMLLKLADSIGMIDDPYQNRYPGFISERLLTYYFDSHGDRYNVAYADKSFLS